MFHNILSCFMQKMEVYDISSFLLLDIGYWTYLVVTTSFAELCIQKNNTNSLARNSEMSEY